MKIQPTQVHGKTWMSWLWLEKKTDKDNLKCVSETLYIAKLSTEVDLSGVYLEMTNQI